jgi:hypothetical protein
LDQERQCRAILAAAGPGPFAADSLEDYARRILRAIELTQRFIEHKDADQAARCAVQVGVLITEAHMKGVWERPALRGVTALETDESLRAAAVSHNTAKRENAGRDHAHWQKMAQDIWNDDKDLAAAEVARRIAKKLPGDRENKPNPDTIRRKIRHPKNKVVTTGQ